MTGITLEDFVRGQVIEGAPVTLTREALVAFAREFDPQPFHLDEAAAKRTFVGTLIGSGWQTASLGMRLLHRDAFLGQSSMGSPGIEALRWLKPVLPGDALRARILVEDVRVSASKADRGFVRFLMTLLNDREEPVMTQGFSVIFARREADPLPPRIALRQEPLDRKAIEPEAALLSLLSEAEIGSVRNLGCHRFEREAITAFAKLYDPQAMHIDPEAAARTHFGGLCASGWHTASVWMKRLHATWARDMALTMEQRLVVPQLGPSPGFKNMRWLKPVYAGDTLHFASRLVDKRPSGSKAGWGLATHYNTAENQNGERVFEFTGTVFWQWSA